MSRSQGRDATMTKYILKVVDWEKAANSIADMRDAYLAERDEARGWRRSGGILGCTMGDMLSR